MKTLIRKSGFLAAVLAMTVGLAGCLDPMNFDPSSIAINVTGRIDFTDVTDGALVIANRSRSVDVESVHIRFDPADWAQFLPNANLSEHQLELLNRERGFTGMPRALQTRAIFLPPTQVTYVATMQWRLREGAEPLPDGSTYGTIVQEFHILSSQQVYQVVLYRNRVGDVVVTPPHTVNPEDSLPGDLGEAAPDANPGEGSSPGVIAPSNRNRMGTFVVQNMTRSQSIDRVVFTNEGNRAISFTMGAVRTRDMQSIALGQGTWEAQVFYTYNGQERASRPRNVVIVPSNDPQALQLHNLFFYRTNMGVYDIDTRWPAVDAAEDQFLPEDQGFGRGTLQIRNNTPRPVESVTIRSRDDRSNSLIVFSSDFRPSGVIALNETGFVEIVGDRDFSIGQGQQFIVQMDLLWGDDVITVERDNVHLHNRVVQIVIDPSELPPDPSLPSPERVGVTVAVNNQTAGDMEARILGVEIRNTRFPVESRYFSVNNWSPSGSIDPAGWARFGVFSSQAMPIGHGDDFAADVFVESMDGSRRAVLTGLRFNSGNFYVAGGAAERVLTLRNQDMPAHWGQELPPSPLPEAGALTLRVINAGRALEHTGARNDNRIRAVVFVEMDRPGAFDGTAGGHSVRRTGKTGVRWAHQHDNMKWGSGAARFDERIQAQTVFLNSQSGRRSFYSLDRSNAANAGMVPNAVRVTFPDIFWGQYVDIPVPAPTRPGTGFAVFFEQNWFGYMFGYARNHARNLSYASIFWLDPEFHGDANNPDSRNMWVQPFVHTTDNTASADHLLGISQSNPPANAVKRILVNVQTHMQRVWFHGESHSHMP
ncbi:MAG: hypothetical protein FWG66_12005 [Spirochaetes bacterium]|nr:hypothetical protein [Spirochaetota bacterium]